MRSAVRDTLLIAAYVVGGLGAAALAGYLTLGPIVFRHTPYLLRFLTVGLSGALIYVAVRTRGLLYALIMIGVLFLSNVVISPRWNPGAFLEAATWSLLPGGAFLAASYLFRAMHRLFLGKFLIMGALLASAYAIGSIITLIRLGRPLQAGVILNPSLAGLRLGALAGFVFEVLDFIGHKLAARSAAKN